MSKKVTLNVYDLDPDRPEGALLFSEEMESTHVDPDADHWENEEYSVDWPDATTRFFIVIEEE